MRCFSTFFSLCFISVLANNSSFAQIDERIVLNKIDEQNGLSDNTVQCIYKDKNNFVWIGTASGLNLLDGSSIKVFKHQAGNIHSISNNNITAIAGNNKGLIWVGTQGGLNLVDPFTENFTAFPLHKNISVKGDRIVCLEIDKNNDLFIGTLDGLFFFDNGTKKISQVFVPGNHDSSILSNRITGLFLDSSNILWVTTYNGLWSYDRKKKSFIHEISKNNDPVFTPLFTCIIADHSGKLWIGTWDKGLKEFDPVTKSLVTYTIPGISDVVSIVETKKSSGGFVLWINGNHLGFDPDKRKIINLRGTSDILSSLQINNLYISKDKWLWIATAGGLYFYNPSKKLFNNHLFPHRITQQGVAIFGWDDNILVSGGGEDFLKMYNRDLIETRNYSEDVKSKDISCLTLAFSGASSVKAGTSEGIADIDLITHRMQYHPLDFLKKKYSSGNFITFLLKDKMGKWWIFPWRNGIWMMDSSYSNLHQIFNNFITENGDPKPLVIADAVEDNNNNLWLADLDEGIIFYNRQLNRFSKPFAKELGIKYSAPQVLYYRNDCYSFSGTDILKWDPGNMHLQIIEPPEQMDKDITSIAADSIGHLWIATQKGLFEYDQEKNSFEHFTYGDGLVSNDMDGTLYCRSDGTMIFGSPDYLTSFQPDSVLTSTNEVPHLILSEVIVNNKPVVFDTAEEMSFEYEKNNFIFRWAVTDYHNPLNNHYYYQLKGIDSNWHYAGNHGDVEFANLSPGEYTLLLKGENSNGLQAGPILKLNFEIQSPFWRTWWFLSLLFILLVCIFYSLYRYRLYQVIKIQKLRNKISLDLHDDIGSTLSSISILSEMALQNKKDAGPAEMLSEIKENTISLMERMDDIVWSINPKNDSPESLFLRIKTFAAKLFEAREINYKIQIAENVNGIQLPMEYRQHIYLIMKEAINNLVKYADCSEAEIIVDLHSSQLNILIKDNGKGFDINDCIAGNGLNSMKKRAKEMNAFLNILSEKEKGTTVILSVKIK